MDVKYLFSDCVYFKDLCKYKTIDLVRASPWTEDKRCRLENQASVHIAIILMEIKKCLFKLNEHLRFAKSRSVCH